MVLPLYLQMDTNFCISLMTTYLSLIQQSTNREHPDQVIDYSIPNANI